MVARSEEDWQLFDLEADRSEVHDLMDEYPQIAEDLARRHDEQARAIGVRPWEEIGLFMPPNRRTSERP